MAAQEVVGAATLLEEPERFILPGCSVLGCGYDVLNGFYADTRSTKLNLFNFPQQLEDLQRVQVLPNRDDSIYLKPKSIVFRSGYATTLYYVSGVDIQSYSTEVSNRTKLGGSYNFFSASVESDIGLSNAQNSELEFSKVQYDVSLYQLHMPPRAAADAFLDPAARAAVDGAIDLLQLFDDYGTHYVASLVMGGRATFTSTTNRYSFSSSESLGLVAEMSYKTLVGSISAQEEARYRKDVELFNRSSKSRLETIGGQPSLGGENFKDHSAAWAASVGDYIALADFVDGSLQGLWTLASTQARRDELLAFYPLYCNLRETKYAATPGPYLRARVVPLSWIQYTDRGSGAHNDLSVCLPDVGGDWFCLGQVALPGKEQLHGSTLVVQEILRGSAALAPVARWDKVWDDAGSLRLHDYSLWRGVPANPVDYVVLSDFFRGRVGDQGAPSPAETSGVVAVRRDCVVPAEVGARVWADKGSRASKDGSVWTVVPVRGDDTALRVQADGRVEPYYVSTLGHNPPSRQGFVLKQSAVVLQEGVATLQPLITGSGSELEVTFVHTPALASKWRHDELTNAGNKFIRAMPTPHGNGVRCRL